MEIKNLVGHCKEFNQLTRQNGESGRDFITWLIENAQVCNFTASEEVGEWQEQAISFQLIIGYYTPYTEVHFMHCKPAGT